MNAIVDQDIADPEQAIRCGSAEYKPLIVHEPLRNGQSNLQQIAPNGQGASGHEIPPEQLEEKSVTIHRFGLQSLRQVATKRCAICVDQPGVMAHRKRYLASESTHDLPDLGLMPDIILVRKKHDLTPREPQRSAEVLRRAEPVGVAQHRRFMSNWRESIDGDLDRPVVGTVINNDDLTDFAILCKNTAEQLAYISLPVESANDDRCSKHGGGGASHN
jgi:hypothetical protein